METDTRLLEAVRNMDREAIIKILDLYSPSLYNYALLIINDPLKADQIVGEVFAKLLEQLSTGHGPTTNLRSHLYETAYHLIVDVARYSHREAPIRVADPVWHEGYSTVDNLQEQFSYNALIVAIQQDLTDDQRHVIVLRFLEGFSLRQIADILGKEVYNVKVIQDRGVAKLRKALGYKVDSSVASELSELRTTVNLEKTSSPKVQNLVERVMSKLAGDGTTDAPPPKKKKGKGK